MYETRSDGAPENSLVDVEDDGDVVDDVDIQRAVMLSSFSNGEYGDYDNVYFPGAPQPSSSGTGQQRTGMCHDTQRGVVHESKTNFDGVPKFPVVVENLKSGWSSSSACRTGCVPPGDEEDEVLYVGGVRCPVTVTVTGELSAAGVDGLHVLPELNNPNDSGLDCRNHLDGYEAGIFFFM
jgi:hypothetical protein